MSYNQAEMVQTKSNLRLLIRITIFLVLVFGINQTISLINAQAIGTKGGSSFQLHSSSDTKGGRSQSAVLSRFRENISSFQQKQAQQQLASDNVQEFSQNSISQSFIQGPQIVEQTSSKSRRVETEVQQTSQQVVRGEPTVFGSIKGTPGTDFPAYTSIPNTKFSCNSVPFDPGMYADESTDCQVYHLCYQGRKESFLCSIGTVFNQAILNCDFWHSVDCAKSSQHYHLNADFGKSSAEPGPGSSITSFSRQTQAKSRFSSQTPVQLPIIIQNQQSRTVDVQQDVPIGREQQASRNIVVSSISSSSGGGKVSAPKVVQSFSSSSSSSHSLGGEILSPKGQQLFGSNSAPRRASLLSPGRQVARMNQLGSQLATESSTRLKVVKDGALIDSDVNQNLPIGSFLLTVTEGLEGPMPDVVTPKSSFGIKTSESFHLSPQNSIQRSKSSQQMYGTFSEQPAGSDKGENEAWKPYFRNKSSKQIGSTASTSATPIPMTPAKVTTESGEADNASPATLDRPDKDPNFSDESTFGTASELPTSTAAATENQVPKSNVSSPLPDSLPITTTTTAQDSSNSIESGEGAMLTSTTPSSLGQTTTGASSVSDVAQTTTTPTALPEPSTSGEPKVTVATISGGNLGNDSPVEDVASEIDKEKQRSSASTSSVEYANTATTAS